MKATVWLSLRFTADRMQNFLLVPLRKSTTKDNGDPVVTGYANKQQLPAVVQFRDDAVCVRESNFNLVVGSLCVLWSEETGSKEVGKVKASRHCGVKQLARLSLIFKESEQANSSQIKDCWLDSKHLPILLPQNIKVFLEQTVEW